MNKSKTLTTLMCQLNFNWLFISIKICSTDNWSITDDVPFHIVVYDTTLYYNSLTSLTSKLGEHHLQGYSLANFAAVVSWILKITISAAQKLTFHMK